MVRHKGLTMRSEVDKTGIRLSTNTYIFSEDKTLFARTFSIVRLIERLFAESRWLFADRNALLSPLRGPNCNQRSRQQPIISEPFYFINFGQISNVVQTEYTGWRILPVAQIKNTPRVSQDIAESQFNQPLPSVALCGQAACQVDLQQHPPSNANP